MKKKSSIVLLCIVMLFSQCVTYRNTYHIKPIRDRHSKQSLRHDQRIGILASIPVAIIMYVFLSHPPKQ